METLFLGFVFYLCIEGAFFALFPGHVRKTMQEAASLDDQGLRALGGMALAAAIFFLLLYRLLR